MIGGAACRLLKNGPKGPQSTKQAEIRVASLPTILAILILRCREATEIARNSCGRADFRRIWIMGKGFGRFVIQLIVLIRKSAQCDGPRGWNKKRKVSPV
jgi:hypothetical protein